MIIEVEHFDNGRIKSLSFRNEDGNLHNPDGPAVQYWYENGQERYRAYYLRGKLHNTYGPAVQEWYPDGQEMYKAYYLSDRRHNPDGPAVQGWYESGQEIRRVYWFHDKLHNPDGPASLGWYPNGEEEYRGYYLHGIHLTEAEFNKQKDTILVTCNGKEVRISKQSAEAMNLV